MPHLLFIFISFLLINHFIPSHSTPRRLQSLHPQTLTRTQTAPAPASAAAAACPLNFTILSAFVDPTSPPHLDLPTQCHYITQGFRLVQSAYLRQTGSRFLPPPSAADACWRSYQSLVETYSPGLDIRSSCGFQTAWISTPGCMNISTKAQFDAVVNASARNEVVRRCNQSLENNTPCGTCMLALSSLQASYLPGPSVGNVSDCTAYPAIYAAAFANIYGPTDPGTAKCLFSLDFTSYGTNRNRRIKLVVLPVLLVSFVLVITSLSGCWFYYASCLKRRRREEEEEERKRRASAELIRIRGGGGWGLDSFEGSTHLMKFTLDEVKRATNNFSRHNIIGRGGYGNVYRGVLPGSAAGPELAFKRFKNCSAGGDSSFTHEVEVIASVRHVNLVALRGYCVATTPLEGHQRIIVCDLMKNGSLHDHLFALEEDGRKGKRLSWPVRRRIALGTARGLAYLHYGAQSTIIHRDIKANNILLDDNFEPKVADFGLAKFNPEGMTHLSTRVAGTMGYVAPEYALYGQLTERSDVYSFGIVLLELLSGKKAIISSADGEGQQPLLLTDWAWSLVQEGRALNVIEDGTPEMGAPGAMEKYVLVAVLCSHPQLYARPTMDQVVKILETDLPVPAIPERPIPLIAKINDIERSMSSSGSCGQFSSPAGYQGYLRSSGSTQSRQSPDVPSK